MKLPGIALAVWMFSICFVPQLFADHLDIYKSRDPFPFDKFPISDGYADLKSLDKERLSTLYSELRKSRADMKETEDKNLLALALGYILFLQENYHSAEKILKNQILGNFILQDYRLYILSLSQRRHAQESLANKNPQSAIRLLKNARDQLLLIHRNYPLSPFIDSIEEDLAKTDRELGDAFFATNNHKKAWQAYRRALMRSFPGNHEFVNQVALALADTYQAAGDWFETEDQYQFILRSNPSAEIIKALTERFQNHAETYKEQFPAFAPLTIQLNSLRIKLESSGNRLQSDKALPEKEIFRNFHTAKFENNGERLSQAAELRKEFAGDLEVDAITKSLIDGLKAELLDREWQSSHDPLLKTLSVQERYALGLGVWSRGMRDNAAVVFESITIDFPLEVSLTHKSLYFLGRIREDQERFDDALTYYRTLIQRYNSGPYTASSFFKLGWLERIRGKLAESETAFIEADRFFESPVYKGLLDVFPENKKYHASTLFWLSDVQKRLNKDALAKQTLADLEQKFPFDFYSLLNRERLDRLLPKEKTPPELLQRIPGLGDIDRKRLNRAEKLASIHLIDWARKELDSFSYQADSPEFMIYLAQLSARVDSYQNSMRIAWRTFESNPNDAHSMLALQFMFPKGFFEPIRKQAERHKLNPYFIASLIRQESAFTPAIKSSANAIGLMQLLPSTARRVAKNMGLPIPDEKDLSDPGVNIPIGSHYLNQLLEGLDNNAVFALAAYNAGPGKVRSWRRLRKDYDILEFMESIPYYETRDYVKKVLRNFILYRALYQERYSDGITDVLTGVRD
ncbi:MAG: transglycosylase SLT domain-containing protein [Candidatus Nitrohelix vancouverensis]|uniref:Transglycosylase SLT domain-containing protein n=1 Tax=Candidatus Nitrohelix vancouverensis TaxID=2705534 RepID=A0A7T0C3W3_9BACT|nr:MAG: transglycosylase SLT domain-containing protein [Candidatus Nitrohelix vancouverensis]